MIYKKAIICTTKNLFSSSTEIGTLSGFSNTTPRQFEEGKWYVGISGNNYYVPNNIVEYEFTENYVYMNTKGSGYGVGKAFKCEANQTYTVSCKWVKYTNNMNIAIGFYDENGNYLSFIGAGYLGKKLTITTPDNCKWFTVCFVGSTGTVYIYNIQLEKGTTLTNYVPYGYLQSYKKVIKVSDNCFVDSYKKAVKVSNIMQVISKPINSAGTELAGTTSTVNGITCEYLADGTGVTLTGTATAYAVFPYFTFWKPVSGHKYLWLYGLENRGESKAYFEIKWTDKNDIGHWFNGTEQIYTLSPTAAEGYATRINFHVVVPTGQTCNGFTWHPQCFDLTEMYGSGNEPTTVDEFKTKFPNDYYAYKPYSFI